MNPEQNAPIDSDLDDSSDSSESTSDSESSEDVDTSLQRTLNYLI